MKKPTFVSEEDKLQYFAARFSYDPETGVFVEPSGKVVKPRYDGYIQLTVYGRDGGKFWRVHTSAHRLAFYITHGELPLVVDHVNGDPSNNQPDNLRSTNQRHNIARSKKVDQDFPGTHWSKKAGRWRASIHVAGRSVFLGQYDIRSHAAFSYQTACEQLGCDIDEMKREYDLPDIVRASIEADVASRLAAAATKPNKPKKKKPKKPKESADQPAQHLPDDPGAPASVVLEDPYHPGQPHDVVGVCGPVDTD